MSVALIVGIKAEKTFLLVSRLRRLPPPRRSWGTPSCWTTILRLDSDTAGLPWLSTRMCSMGCIWWMVSLCEVNHQPFTTCTLPTFDGYWFGHRRCRENEQVENFSRPGDKMSALWVTFLLTTLSPTYLLTTVGCPEQFNVSTCCWLFWECGFWKLLSQQSLP